MWLDKFLKTEKTNPRKRVFLLLMTERFIPEIQIPEQREELPTASQFREFRAALSVVYATKPEGEAFRLTQPSSLSRQAHELFISGQRVPPELAEFYYPDVPSPVDLAELSDRRLEELIQVFGPDIIRAKMVSKSVAEGNGVILPVGGACLVESFGTKMLDEGNACKDLEIKTQTAQALIDNAPYYTQVTGAMLLGGSAKMGLMYREEFPWHERATKDYRIENALEQAVAVYDRIVAAQIRRGQLIDPQFSLITLPFSSLDLEKEGLLREWFNLTMTTLPAGISPFRKKEYTPGEFDQSWVRYTYNGPRILEVVRNKLEEIDVFLNGTSMHVRTKQLDHLGGPTDLLKDFGRLDYEELKRLRKYRELFGISIDSYLANDVDNDSIGFVGFDDFAIDGDLVHQAIFVETLSGSSGKRGKIPGTKEEVEEALSSIVRLNANNLPEHLAFLDFVAIAESQQISTLREIIKLRRAISRMSQNLETLTFENQITKRRLGIDQKQKELNGLMSQIPEDLLEKEEQFSGFPKASVLPLSDNLIVSHAIQLAFDPDMREFVCDAAFIETSNMPETEKKSLLMQKMQEILPKIKEYLTFIMIGGEYPSLRSQRIYTPIRNGVPEV